MVFSSLIFIFGFLPAFLAVYYVVPARFRSAWILIGSYAFYGWWRLEYLAVVVGISLVSFICANAALAAKSKKRKSLWVKLGVGTDLAVLGYFKYTYFIAESIDAALISFDGASLGVEKIVLPIGISFLTFQSISYILDVSRKDAPPARTVMDFLAFSALFPQLIAGPVLRYKDVADQFQSRTHSLLVFQSGCKRFVQGLAMKLLIADTVAPLADRMFALDAPTMAEAWLGAGAYSIQLLFDFAGYSAMAIGLGLMIGFRFVENFNAPYISQSVTEFWRRWHISLSNWLRDYLYIPLGGNRGGTLKTFRNLMLTMVLGGFWHGANWTFIIWGAWHGLLLSLERAIGSKSRKRVWPRYTGWPFTMVAVIVGWVMFRAATVTDAFEMYRGMVGLNGINISAETIYFNQPIEFVGLIVGAILSIAPSINPRVSVPQYLMSLQLFTPLMFVGCTIVLSARAHSPFLYFQF
ncbi:alginate O-acetyltransferase complex protein AlgI [Cognatiyoonia sediminum]|uniref:Probable alginate O-acetylase AlgI n=1 Tax=Cognatiyoonia sediminum TaxID=1508389 RepID=A0A1M5SSQ8_9RHOB|nr:MBOAT family protein [Cognatiyoonia sediminum]SHH41545.1 alginate O-acetyltransferase complex protein AlgI [Cognatiyoonia sediminum]